MHKEHGKKIYVTELLLANLLKCPCQPHDPLQYAALLVKDKVTSSAAPNELPFSP